MKKRLPTGIQSFSKLRRKECLYVDKTEHIYNMVTTGGGVYFLSRPRRFGKSVLVSTLDALFSGRKELFEGLFIYDKWDWTQQYPVIRLDFSGLTVKTPVELEESLSFFVKSTANKYNISLSGAHYKLQFGELIDKLHTSTGRQVVVLVDEYDNPIIDHLSNKETLEANKDILHNFYKVLKASDDHIEFIFLTGVSKFSGLSVFSALNNPEDITLNEEFAAICGYT
ncbi:MAG: AAA family ATPase, partial [Prevotellaceae bacterium]|nr:AAA family ATPase [Prevotellaceae bacterium]